MLYKLMKLYTTYMTYDIRSPMPHIVGPPGCGKSSVIDELGKTLGVSVHTINVSRLSPLEVEGVQMPRTVLDSMHLEMLPATFWTQLKEGDILRFDEFLRGMPEVYNALLDIFTSRQVGPLTLPKVFIVGASNSVATYDAALTDRLLHLPVPDPRRNKAARNHLGKLIVDALGLMPSTADSSEMENLLATHVLPMFDVLDSFKGVGSTPAGQNHSGYSVRNLIGQAQFREVQCSELEEVIEINNRRAMSAAKPQYVLLLHATTNHIHTYKPEAEKLLKVMDKLTEVQQKNLLLNLQIIEVAENNSAAYTEKEDSDDDTDVFI